MARNHAFTHEQIAAAVRADEPMRWLAARVELGDDSSALTRGVERMWAASVARMLTDDGRYGSYLADTIVDEIGELLLDGDSDPAAHAIALLMQTDLLDEAEWRTEDLDARCAEDADRRAEARRDAARGL